MNEKQFEKIERYVHGEMSSQERLRFEAELQTDKELSTNMEVYQMIEGEMENYDKEAALKASLQSIGASFVSEHKTSTVKQPAAKVIPANPVHSMPKATNHWKGWAVAAAIILVIVSTGIYYFVKEANTNSAGIVTNRKKNSAPVAPVTDSVPVTHQPGQPPPTAKADTLKSNPSNTNKQKTPASLSPAVLFTQNFTPDAVPEDKPDVLEEAFEDYENKDYQNAKVAINDANLDFVTRGQQVSPELTKWYAQYYKGIIYLAIDSTDSAIAELEDAANTTIDSLLHVKAQWYLALGYLKADKVKQAKDVLRQIAANNNAKTYRIKAQLLLRKVAAIKH